MQENRSFDHYFGTLPGVRGFADPAAITLSTGRSVFYQPDPKNPDGYLLPYHLDTHTTNAQAIPSTSHAWAVQHSAWDSGKMDNWLPAHLAADGKNGPFTMGYYEREDIPFQFALAESFTPNLQNIPVRTEEGRKIRRAFVAPPGHKLISADYSQIELRLLAHVADIPALKNAFAERPRHSRDDRLRNVRRADRGHAGRDPARAKAINFGIIYGISAFGLANQLGIPREEAGAYIRKYFERFPGIRAYMDATKSTARAKGYVTTIFGRKCHYPRINASNVVRARLQRTRGDQRAASGLGRRHHPPRHGAHGRCAGARRLERAHAAHGA